MKNLFPIFRIGFVLAFAALLWNYLPRLKVDNSLERWILEDDPEIAGYRNFLQDFGSDALLVIAVDPGGKAMEKAREEMIPFIEQVSHLQGVNQVAEWPLPYVKVKEKTGKHLLVYLIGFDPPSYLNPSRPELLDQIDEVLAGVPFTTHLAGTGVLHRAINRETRSSIGLFLGIGMAMLLVALSLVLRSFRAVLMVMVVAVGGVASILLTASLFRVPIGIVHSVLPILILFYGTSVSIHVLFHQGNFRKVLVPTLLAGVTTSVGIGVFLFDEIPLLQDFSILGLGGLAGSFLWALVIFFPQTFFFSLPERFSGTFSRFPVFRRRNLLIIFGLLMLLSLLGISRLRVDIYSLAVLPKDNPAVLDHYFIEQQVGNYFPLEYIVDRKRVKQKQVEAWMEEVMKLDEIAGHMSFYQFPAMANPTEYGYRSRQSGNLVRVTFFVPLLSTKQGKELVGKIETLSAGIFQDYLPEVTGFVTLYSLVAHKLGISFRQSLLSAFVVILLAMALYFRNWRMILAALIGNAFPILLILGLMGWFHIYLDMVTVPIGCLLLSIVVDDTLHLMFWYKKNGDIHSALAEAGPGIFYTSLFLIIGFVILIGSGAPPVKYFGILSILALLSALAGDLLLLPSLLNKPTKNHGNP